MATCLKITGLTIKCLGVDYIYSSIDERKRLANYSGIEAAQILYYGE